MMLQHLNIRPARETDMARVCEIALQAWIRVYESFRNILGEGMYADLCAHWEEAKERQIRNHFAGHPAWVLVAESEDEILGFVSYHIEPTRHLGVIGNNAVAPEAQGQGIATRMYQHVLDQFRQQGLKYAQVQTGLDEGHAPARRAYEKAGFDIARPEVVYHQYL